MRLCFSGISPETDQGKVNTLLYAVLKEVWHVEEVSNTFTKLRHGTLGERTDQLHVTVRTSYTSWCLAIYSQFINSQWPSSILLIFHVYNHSSARCISMGLNRWSMHFISWQSLRYPPGNNQYESSGGAFHIPPFNWEDGGTDEDADGIEWEDVTKAVDIDRSLWSSTSSMCGQDGGLWECSFWRSQGTS